MARFSKAYQEGLDAYASSLRAQSEISGVIKELSKELQQATKGNIEKVAIVRRPRPLPPPDEQEAALGGAAYSAKVLSHMSKQFPFLVAFRRGTGRKRKDVPLCEITIAPGGYPVTLTYSGKDVRANDRPSLEKAIEDLLRHPETGRDLSEIAQGAASTHVCPIPVQPADATPTEDLPS